KRNFEHTHWQNPPPGAVPSCHVAPPFRETLSLPALKFQPSRSLRRPTGETPLSVLTTSAAPARGAGEDRGEGARVTRASRISIPPPIASPRSAAVAINCTRHD